MKQHLKLKHPDLYAEYLRNNGGDDSSSSPICESHSKRPDSMKKGGKTKDKDKNKNKNKDKDKDKNKDKDKDEDEDKSDDSSES